MPEDINIKIITSASITDLITLYKSAGWWESSYSHDGHNDQSPEFLNRIVKDSALFVGAFVNEQMIGMGRALSDMASDAYIQDVAVLDEFKGKGIGKKIVQILVKKLKENGVDWIGIVAQPGTSSFYEELGFEQLKDHVPLKYKG